MCEEVLVWLSLLGGPGGDLLFHALRRSTIGAEGFHGRVRDGIGCFTLAMATRSSKQRRCGWMFRDFLFRGGSRLPPAWVPGCFADRVVCGVCGLVRTHGGIVVGSSSLASD